MTNIEPRIGEVYLIKFNGNQHIQNGVRPGVIFQNDVGNKCSPNVVALPLTSVIKKAYMPTHVFIPASNSGLRKNSVVQCETPMSISKDCVIKYLTKLSEQDMAKIAFASLLSSAAIHFMTKEALENAWERSHQMVSV